MLNIQGGFGDQSRFFNTKFNCVGRIKTVFKQLWKGLMGKFDYNYPKTEQLCQKVGIFFYLLREMVNSTI